MSPPAAEDGPDAARAKRRVCALFDACRAVAEGERTEVPGLASDRASPAARAVAARDAALVSVLFGARVPRETALGLPLAAYDPATGRLEVGEARRPRAVDGARRALDDWLSARGTRPGPLLCRVAPSGEVRPDGLTSRDVDRVLSRWARRAGIEPFDPEVDPETFRRLYRSPWWKPADTEEPDDPGGRGDPRG